MDTHHELHYKNKDNLTSSASNGKDSKCSVTTRTGKTLRKKEKSNQDKGKKERILAPLPVCRSQPEFFSMSLNVMANGKKHNGEEYSVSPKFFPNVTIHVIMRT